MSWMEYKLLTSSDIQAAGQALPTANSIGGAVYVNLTTSENLTLLVAGIVVSVDFTASKVSYSVAFPIAPQPREGVTMYAVVENIPSDLISSNAGLTDVVLDSVGEDTFAQIERAAHEGALGENNLADPSEAQKAAGNYKVGRTSLHDMDIAIEQPRGSVRSGTNDKTGIAWSNRMAAHYGYLAGTTGADGDGLDVFIGVHPESTLVYVINQVDPGTGAFDEHKIMLGMSSQDEAVAAYQNSYDKGWKGLGSVVPATIDQLKEWIGAGKTSAPFAELAATLNQGYEIMKQVTWSGEEPNKVTYDQVLYDVRRHDKDGLLLDAVSLDDILDDTDGSMTLDALVSSFSKLPRKMAQLEAVMERASELVQPVAWQLTEPFKQRGSANVAALFELSDGQTLTIYFHNPDLTPAKILPTDEMVSWKWMLNKKDITIVAAPERGEELSVRIVASRIMRLAAKNSAAFTRANTKRAERMQNIAALRDQVAEKEGLLLSLQKTLEVRRIERETVPAAAAEPSPSASDPLTDPIVVALAVGAVEPVLADEVSSEPAGGAPSNEPSDDPLAAALAAGAIEPDLVTVVETNQEAVASGVDPIVDPIAAALAAGAVDPELTSADVLAASPPIEAVGAPVADVDPTNALGYAIARADPELFLKYQDRLDAFFQERIAALCTALHELGWSSIKDGSGDMSKGLRATFATSKVGAGNNVVGYSVRIMDGTDFQAELGDELTQSIEEFAQKIDAVATNSGVVPSPIDTLTSRLEQAASLSGKTVVEVLAAFKNAAGAMGEQTALDLLDKTIADYIARAPVVPLAADESVELKAASSVSLGVEPALLVEDPLPELPAGAAVPNELQTDIPSAHVGESPPPVEDGPIADPIADPIAAAEVAGAVGGHLVVGEPSQDAAVLAQRAADVELIQSVVDGQADVWDADLAGNLEATFGRIQDDPNLVSLWKRAVTAYTDAMMAESVSKLAA